MTTPADPFAESEVAALIVRFAALETDPYREGPKCQLIDQLGTAALYSVAALEVVAAALADPDIHDIGGDNPFNAYFETVAEHAYYALRRIGARAEPLIVAQLERSLIRGDDARRRAGAFDDVTGVACREYAARLLQDLPVLAPATLDVLLRCATDPSSRVQQAVGSALRGQTAAAGLVANPATRLVGVIAAPDLGSDALIEMTRDPSFHVRVAAIRRLRALSTLPDHAAPALIQCLADRDRHVADEALATLGELAPNDTTVTEALFALGRRGDVRALSTLSRRSPAQLQPLVPRLLTWLASEDKDRDDAALVLGGLADTAPRDVAIALAVRLAGLNRRDSRDERKYHVMLDALRRLGRAALPALRQIKTAARHPDQRIRDDASTLVATLRAVEP